MVEILLFQLSVQHFITPNGKILKHCILQNTCGGLAALYCYDKYPRKLNKIKIVFDLQFRFFQTTAVLYYCFLQCRSILTEEDKQQRKSAHFLKTRWKEESEGTWAKEFLFSACLQRTTSSTRTYLFDSNIAPTSIVTNYQWVSLQIRLSHHDLITSLRPS